MKKILFFVALALIAPALRAQSTTVSATVQDVDAVVYGNGTVTANFVPAQNFPSATYVWSGGALSQTITGSLNSSGVFSVSIPSNGSISPAGSQWSFTACTFNGLSCANAIVTVVGSTQSISTQMQANAPLVIASGLFVPKSIGANGTTLTIWGSPNNSSPLIQVYDYLGNSLLKLTSAGALSCVSGCGGGGGGVTLVSGTANQVDVATGSTTPVISLDAAITLPGSLTAPTGGSITFSGTGTNNANELNGTSLAGLGTGIYLFTAGVPSLLSPTNCGAGVAAIGITASGNATGCFTPGGTPGGTVNSVQYQLNSTTFGGITSPAVQGQYDCGYFPTTGTAVTPTCPQVGFGGGQDLTGSSTALTVAYSDNGQIDRHVKAASGTGAITLPTPTTLNNANFGFKYCNDSAQTDVITPTTLTIQAGTGSAASTLNVAPGVCYFIQPDPSAATTNWVADISQASGASAGGVPFGPGAGSVNVMTVTTNTGTVTNATGQIVNVLTNLANTTTTPTLNADGAGAQTIKKIGDAGALVALVNGDYGATAGASYYTFISNGTNWILQNPQTPNVAGIVAAAAINTAGGVGIGAAQGFTFNGRSGIFSPADGKLELFNNAATSFTQIQFGGASSSFPALGISGTTITAQLADASAGAPFSASTLTSTVTTGTAPLTVTSTTPVANFTASNHPTEQFCGTTTTCSHTAETGPKIVFGSAPLVSGTPSAATVTGISPAFTATADYVCTVSAPGASAATALLGVTNVSASSFTITGPASVTTVISYICVGF